MIKAGCWGKNHCQLHRFFGWKDVKLQKHAPFSVSAADCFVSDTSLRGKVEISTDEIAAHPEYMCDAGIMEWDLTIDKQIAFNVGYGASRLFRAIKAFEMYWHAEGMKTQYNGTVTLNGTRYTVRPESSYGYADKNWGRGFTSPWVWLSSNCMKSNITGKQLTNSVFDIGGGRPKIYFAALDRKLLGAFYHEGTEYEFNFSKFWQLPRTKFTFKENDTYVLWHVRQENRTAVIDVKVRCKKKDMLLVNYEAPDGTKRHNKLWNGGNGTGRIKLYKKNNGTLQLIDDISVTHIGCEYGEYN